MSGSTLVLGQPSSDITVLAADIGGTHARIGIVRAADSGRSPGRLESFATYECARYPSLDAMLSHYLREHALGTVHYASIACAGYLTHGRVLNSNLPWEVALTQLKQSMGFRDLRLINDFEALAHVAPELDGADSTWIAGPDQPVQNRMLVVGPGTGLGAALNVPDGSGGRFVLTTEAGQAAFAPGNDEELRVLSWLLGSATHVPVEQIVSGPGLLLLYRTLAAMEDRPSTCGSPADVTEAATDGNDPFALRVLQIFCGLLGSTIGNLVLYYGAEGGVLLAGGILPRIIRFLRHSTFHERLVDKGLMRPVLEQVPIRLLERNDLGALGAASWYLHRRPPSALAREAID